MSSQQLQSEVEALRREGYAIEIVTEGKWDLVIIRQYAVKAGYSKQITDLLIKAPQSYPNGKLDMFWTDKDLLLANGKVPEKANNIANHNGKEWRRFSWHPKSWNPGRDNLKTYLEFINARFDKGC